ncbi:Probable sensor-like histidine kinase YehU [[Eubacterium] contortum]|uniref:Probable sensor-like histidine kinase YehU n=1 Tax=Faecalicatena contorta TaxID=39482 RepID=A0A174GB69_9FIRM|nr:sensor histidine kinase [Faecalicatena contorta]CUO58368.1 Probable sensor-like histidine kinase YehU [[Eubacterium] contortum] [Faecalicatena contorta]
MKKIKSYVKNLSINQKFVLSLLTFLIIPLVILLFIVNYNIRLSMNTNTCETNLEILKQTRNGISNFINDIKLVSLNVGTDDDVQDLIRMYHQQAPASEKEKQRVDTSFRVRSALEARESIRSISIFNKDEMIYQYGDFVMEEDRQFISRLDQLDGIPLWTSVHNGQTTSYGAVYKKIYLLQAIKDMRTFQVIAYERLTIDEAGLREQYKGLLEGNSRIVILGSDGKILSASEKDMTGRNYTAAGIEKLPQEEYGYQVRGNQVTTWYSLDKPGWTIIKLDSAQELFRSNMLGNSIIILCILFTIIFGAIFMLLQRKTMIIPIVRLSQEARDFKKENFKMPLLTDSKDEIGRLNQNLTQMVEYIQDLILNQYENKIKRREIELKYMQSQMNPHFLYNTLDSIRWMAVMEGETEIAEQVEALSDIFRHALSGGKEVVTVEKEIEHLRNYILIQKNRFGDRLQVNIRVEDSVRDCEVMKLILQPLVENAIVHGLEDKMEGGTVEVSVQKEDNTLVYRVEDDGVGADEERINNYLKEKEEEHNVFALKNIDERIKIKYGEEYGLSFHSTIGAGTRVEVRLPFAAEKNVE